MKEQRMQMAKALLEKRTGVGREANATRPKGAPHVQTPHVQTPHAEPARVGKYSDLHPEVLDHVHKYLQEFRKGLSRG